MYKLTLITISHPHYSVDRDKMLCFIQTVIGSLLKNNQCVIVLRYVFEAEVKERIICTVILFSV